MTEPTAEIMRDIDHLDRLPLTIAAPIIPGASVFELDGQLLLDDIDDLIDGEPDMEARLR